MAEQLSETSEAFRTLETPGFVMSDNWLAWRTANDVANTGEQLGVSDEQRRIIKDIAVFTSRRLLTALRESHDLSGYLTASGAGVALINTRVLQQDEVA